MPVALALMMGVLLLEFQFPYPVTAAILCFTLLILIIWWIIVGRHPAAVIVKNKLKIRGSVFSSVVIPKSEVEAISYTGGKRVWARDGYYIQDTLTVKLKGYSLWSIPITAQVDHVSNKRLYRFINRYFMKVPFNGHRVKE